MTCHDRLRMIRRLRLPESPDADSRRARARPNGSPQGRGRRVGERFGQDDRRPADSPTARCPVRRARRARPRAGLERAQLPTRSAPARRPDRRAGRLGDRRRLHGPRSGISSWRGPTSSCGSTCPCASGCRGSCCAPPGGVAAAEEIWNGNRESLRGVVWGRDALLPYALRNASAAATHATRPARALPDRAAALAGRGRGRCLERIASLTASGRVAGQRRRPGLRSLSHATTRRPIQIGVSST